MTEATSESEEHEPVFPFFDEVVNSSILAHKYQAKITSLHAISLRWTIPYLSFSVFQFPLQVGLEDLILLIQVPIRIPPLQQSLKLLRGRHNCR
jgi:hypothetical protein